MASTNETTTARHPWEEAGLGKAPFKLASVFDSEAEAGLDGFVRWEGADGVEHVTTPGGTCAECGRAIKILCRIEDADGRRFTVGSTCVEKVAKFSSRAAKETKVAVRKIAKTKREAREGTRITAAAAALESDETVRTFLASFPCQNAWRRERGDTWLDAVSFAFERSGHSGKMRYTKLVERIQRGKQKAPSWA